MISQAIRNDDYARGVRASLHYCMDCRPGKAKSERLAKEMGL